MENPQDSWKELANSALVHVYDAKSDILFPI